MSKISKFFVFALVFLIALNAAYAASFDVTVTPVNDKIVVDEIAEFEVAVQNNLDMEGEFTIKKAGYPFWDMYTKPLQNPITLKVPAQSSVSINLFVDPLYITSVDTYTLDVGVVLQRTGEEKKVPVTVGIKSTEPLIGNYIPTVVTSTSISPEKVDPREPLSVKIVLNNQNVLDYPNLTIKVESNLFKEGRMIVSPIVKEFEIKEYATEEELPKEQSFLKVRKGIKVASNSPEYSGVVKLETTPLKNLFMSTSPRADFVKENGKLYLAWQVRLGSDRTMHVYTTENYRPIVVIAALAIIAIALYFMFRSPIVVRKGIANVGMSEGGISDAKVVVRVKN